jgi:hypothetical protein
MSEYEVVSSDTVDAPDWDFATTNELDAHACQAIVDTTARLASLFESPERPAGTAPHQVVQLPCPNGTNINVQLQYVGMLAQHARENGVVIREVAFRVDYSEMRGELALALARAVDLEVADAETADKH